MIRSNAKTSYDINTIPDAETEHVFLEDKMNVMNSNTSMNNLHSFTSEYAAWVSLQIPGQHIWPAYVLVIR